MLTLVPALKRKRSKAVFGNPGQFQHATSFLTDIPVTRDTSRSSVAFTTLLFTRRMRGELWLSNSPPMVFRALLGGS